MAHDWLSIHIFYYSNPERMITDCLEPVTLQLRAQRSIQRFFFIRYWMEGMHIRLRLLPSQGVRREEVWEQLEPTIATYLQRYPALYDSMNRFLPDYYKTFFLAEYGEEKWNETYGENGIMPTRPNNSFASIEYEPEYHYYGGNSGVELAEWHFEQSSLLVMELLRGHNAHLRTIKLGLSFQLALPFYLEFLQDTQAIIAYLAATIERWEESFGLAGAFENYERKYQRMAPSLHRCLAQIERAVKRRESEGLAAFERRWIEHIRELRCRIDTLIARQELVFPGQEGGLEREAVYRRLLYRYIHMTNNRLGVTIPDEIYLAYLLKSALAVQAMPTGERAD